ncbi:MAG: biosynthetic-type acetolactate synthase large subunit [Clostridia bacterium]|nr:biosynthetic-type acetolactate synthase large subunit [Clostridia bacterium]
MISGAEIMVKCLEKEGVKLLFGYPGAVICPFFDKLGETDIKAVLVRQEQNAAHAASGYARALSTVGVCVATSGPGALNMITGIATAYMDSIPLVAITGQVKSDLLGRDVFQEADITGACESFVKHSYLVKNTAELPQVFKEAFHIASTGRPGPVLIDVPVDVQTGEIESFEYPEKVNIISYKPSVQGHPMQIKRALEMINESKKPVICAGGGVLTSGAKPKFREFIEKTGIPVVSTMMGIGIMPSDDPQYVGMLGSHGRKAANITVHNADLIILCGARVGDRAVASPDQVVEHANVIHIDIDPAEIGKNMKTSIPIVGDMRNVLGQLLKEINYTTPDEWKQQVAEWKKEYEPVPQIFDGYVEPKSFIAELSGMVHSKAIMCADVGQNQIWCANNCRLRDGRFFTSGGMGTMGYSVPAAVGAKLARPTRDVIAVCGDGSFQMSMNELATIAVEKLNVKIIVMRNTVLGMVHELQDKFYGSRYEVTEIHDVPDFVKLAQSYGIDAACASSNEEALKYSREMLKSDKPFVLVCNVNPKTTSV